MRYTELRYSREHWQFLITRQGSEYAAFVILTDTPGSEHRRRIAVVEEWNDLDTMIGVWCKQRALETLRGAPLYRVKLAGWQGVRREG